MHAFASIHPGTLTNYFPKAISFIFIWEFFLLLQFYYFVVFYFVFVFIFILGASQMRRDCSDGTLGGSIQGSLAITKTQSANPHARPRCCSINTLWFAPGGVGHEGRRTVRAREGTPRFPSREPLSGDHYASEPPTRVPRNPLSERPPLCDGVHRRRGWSHCVSQRRGPPPFGVSPECRSAHLG